MKPNSANHTEPDLWVFAYGSLMWNPGFAYVERQRATLHGSHRSLCIYSTHYRGTQSCPGLVMGLDRGGSCHGFAFRVAGEHIGETRAYLAARELITHVYKEVTRPLRLADGRRVPGLCYVADPTHPQYAGRLTREETLRLIRQGCGNAGPCCDYVLNTLDALADLGIKDHALDWLGAALRPS
jgi:glutathione-specific gamma-glutamylcyclotransferase